MIPSWPFLLAICLDRSLVVPLAQTSYLVWQGHARHGQRYSLGALSEHLEDKSRYPIENLDKCDD